MMMGLMGLGLIVPLLLIGFVAYALGWRLQFNHIGRSSTGETPIDILKARYVRGEISRVEYEQMHRDLEG